MSDVILLVDGQELPAQRGQRLLWALLDAGLSIPNLCATRGQEPPFGGCRLCFVEVAGQRGPVTSCTQKVQDGLVVTTRSPAVDRLVRAGFEALLSNHRLDCKRCPGNGRCALQTIARQRKIPLQGKRLPKIDFDYPVDLSHPDFGFDRNHCVLCGRCVEVGERELGGGILTFSRRGIRTAIETFDGQPLGAEDCAGFARCVEVCPVGALYLRQPGKPDQP